MKTGTVFWVKMNHFSILLSTNKMLYLKKNVHTVIHFWRYWCLHINSLSNPHTTYPSQNLPIQLCIQLWLPFRLASSLFELALIDQYSHTSAVPASANQADTTNRILAAPNVCLCYNSDAVCKEFTCRPRRS